MLGLRELKKGIEQKNKNVQQNIQCHSRATSTYFLGDAIHSFVLLKKLIRLCIILVELLGNIRTYVAILLLNGLCYFHGLFRRDSCLPLSQQLLHKVRYITTSDWNVLNAAANNIAFSLEEKNSTESSSHSL